MLFGQVVPLAQEDAARPVETGFGGMRLGLTLELLMERAIVTGRFLIENDQVGAESAQSPVGVREQKFANQGEMARLGCRNDQHGKVARNSIGPQHRLSQPVANQPVSGWPHAPVGIQQVTGEFLIAMGCRGTDTQVAELELRAGPGHFKRASHGFLALIFGHQRQRFLAGGSCQCDEIQLQPIARLKCEAAAQTENRIEYGSCRPGEIAAQGFRHGGIARASEERRPVGLELDRARSADQNMCSPDGRIVGGTGTAVRQQDTRLGLFRLNEHFRERRMEGVGTMRRHRQLQVTRKFEAPAASGTIRNGDAPQLGVVVRGDGDVEDGLDLECAALKLRVVGGEANPSTAERASHGLICGRPGGSRL